MRPPSEGGEGGGAAVSRPELCSLAGRQSEHAGFEALRLRYSAPHQSFFFFTRAAHLEGGEGSGAEVLDAVSEGEVYKHVGPSVDCV
jgi:hypothetical protein